jgi:hypothetical protein
MAPDYDLSNLPTAQVELWICLQVDAIFGQIMADQAARLGFPLALGDGIVSAIKEKPQAIFGNGVRGVGV